MKALRDLMLSCIISLCLLKEGLATYNFLNKGDKIALVAPAAAADENAVKILIQLLTDSGLVPIYEMIKEPSPYGTHYTQMPYSSSDRERIEHFQAALNSDAKAIWVLHGGQGCEKIVAALEKGIMTCPSHRKLIIGFSGVTNLHLYFQNKGWPCLHGSVGTISKETYEFTQNPINTKASLQKIINILTGKTRSLTYALELLNQLAKQDSQVIDNVHIVGGAMNILITHMGTATALKGKGKFVFIEDEPQRPERVETMLMGLIRSGTFKNCKGVILGSFSDPQFNQTRFSSVKPILLERMQEILKESGIKVPILHADNFGHGELNDPLPLGTHTTIKLGKTPTLIVDAVWE